LSASLTPGLHLLLVTRGWGRVTVPLLLIERIAMVSRLVAA